MDLWSISKFVTKVGGAVLIAWQLAGQFDAAMQKHLTATFATKEDFHRLEDKLDQALLRLPGAAAKKK